MPRSCREFGWHALGGAADVGMFCRRHAYLAVVEYSFAVSNTGGEWGRRHYLCLFAVPIPLGRSVDMES